MGPCPPNEPVFLLFNEESINDLHCGMPAFGAESPLKNLDVRVNVPRFRFRPVLHDPYRDVWANRAFKRPFVVIRRIRLNISEPHLRLADFTKRTTDNPLLRKCLIFSHATTFVWLARHTHKLRFQ